jgi:hypothetical protein
VLLFDYSNCSNVSFENSTQVGNPGDPPSSGQVRSEKVKFFIHQICSQQVQSGVSVDINGCKQMAERDDQLAELIYLSPIRFAQLLDPFAAVRSVQEAAADECNERIQSSTFTIQDLRTTYSSEIAVGVANSVPSCKSFFVEVAPSPANTPPTTACFEPSSFQDGSASKPWQIGSCECFQEIENSSSVKGPDQHVRLTSDLDCSSFSAPDGFKSISNFLGILDGANHTIRNLNLESSDQDSALFVLQLGTVKNLNFENLHLSALTPGKISTLHLRPSNVTGVETVFENVNIRSSTMRADPTNGSAFGLTNKLIGQVIGSSVTGRLEADKVAGLVGLNEALRVRSPSNSQVSQILNSTFTGSLKGRTSMGGLVETNFGMISDCTAQLLVDVQNSDSEFHFGGIAANNLAGGEISRVNVLGSASLTYDFNTSPVTISFGTLIGINGTALVGNFLYRHVIGSIRDSRSSLSYIIRITSTASTPEDLFSIGDLAGSGPRGVDATNIFSGTGNVTTP